MISGPTGGDVVVEDELVDELDEDELDEDELEGLNFVPASLARALDALRADHDFLTAGGVFPKDLLETWIEF